MGMDDAQIEAVVELALVKAKRVQRESRMLVQQLAQVRDTLQSKETQGNGSSKAKRSSTVEER